MTSFTFENEEALGLDEADPLSSLRDQFTIPLDSDGGEEAYFAGNSLGLMPKDTPTAMLGALSDWVTREFEGTLREMNPGIDTMKSFLPCRRTW